MEDLWMQYAVNLVEEMEIGEGNIERNAPREYIPYTDAFLLSDVKFKRYFRLNKNLATQLIEAVRPAIPNLRSSSISLERKVLSTLRFYATGGYQANIGNDFTLGVSQSTLSRALAEVTTAINNLMLDDYIRFPITPEEQNIEKQKFMELGNFPGVISAIDGTHVAIIAPPKNDLQYLEGVYVNRKNFHSINVELGCNADMKITSINARFPGSTHDSHIWAFGSVRQFMLQQYEAGQRNTWLIGDSGYPLEPWMMVPVHNPPAGTPMAEFNRRQIKCRNVENGALAFLSPGSDAFCNTDTSTTIHVSPARS